MGMIGISEGEERWNGLEGMFEVTMAKNFSKLRTNTNQRFRKMKEHF